jgi:hypothetical protein
MTIGKEDIIYGSYWEKLNAIFIYPNKYFKNLLLDKLRKSKIKKNKKNQNHGKLSCFFPSIQVIALIFSNNLIDANPIVILLKNNKKYPKLINKYFENLKSENLVS